MENHQWALLIKQSCKCPFKNVPCNRRLHLHLSLMGSSVRTVISDNDVANIRKELKTDK